MNAPDNAQDHAQAVQLDGFTYPVEQVAAALFDSVWQRMATDGRCDAFGGAEYTRIRQNWHGVLLWLLMVDFIDKLQQYPKSKPVGCQWITGKMF